MTAGDYYNNEPPSLSTSWTAYDSAYRREADEENPKDRVGKTKPPLQLVPPVALIQTAMAMEYGAYKAPRVGGGFGYGPYNWREIKVCISSYIAAAQRHLASFWDGEDADSDSGVHPLAHAIASLSIVLDAISVGKAVDDRPPRGGAKAEITKFTKQTLVKEPVK